MLRERDISRQVARRCALADASDAQAAICSVCLQPLTEGAAVALACGHVFHRTCIPRQDRTTCPNCRADLEEDDMKPLYL